MSKLNGVVRVGIVVSITGKTSPSQVCLDALTTRQYTPG